MLSRNGFKVGMQDGLTLAWERHREEREMMEQASGCPATLSMVPASEVRKVVGGAQGWVDALINGNGGGYHLPFPGNPGKQRAWLASYAAGCQAGVRRYVAEFMAEDMEVAGEGD